MIRLFMPSLLFFALAGAEVSAKGEVSPLPERRPVVKKDGLHPFVKAFKKFPLLAQKAAQYKVDLHYKESQEAKDLMALIEELKPGGRLNRFELGLIVKDQELGRAVFESQRLAKLWTQRFCHLSSKQMGNINGTVGDAAKHYFISALLAGFVGRSKAGQFLTSRELVLPEDFGWKSRQKWTRDGRYKTRLQRDIDMHRMDLLNNEAGYAFAETRPSLNVENSEAIDQQLYFNGLEQAIATKRVVWLEKMPASLKAHRRCQH